jgi:hypothetical protein
MHPKMPPPGSKPAKGLMIAIGAPKPDKMPPPGSDDEPDDTGESESTDGRGVPPDAVDYHTADEHCGVCEYNKGGQCDWLKMPVGDGDHCELFEAKGGEQDGDDMGGSSDERDMGHGNGPTPPPI